MPQPITRASALMFALAASLGGSLLLAGCTADEPAAAPATADGSATGASPSTPSSSPAPADPPESTPPATASIPTDCVQALGDAATSSLFAATPLNDPAQLGGEPGGVRVPKTPTDGEEPGKAILDAAKLFCLWRAPNVDTTALTLSVGTASSALADQYFAELVRSGYKCSSVHEGRLCQNVFRDQNYPVDDADTFFYRDATFIQVYQSNFPTDDLIGSVSRVIWG